MKIKLLKMIGVIIIIGMILSIIYLFYQNSNHNDRPENIPCTAIWKGGHDGGCWIELVNIRTDTIRFRIFNEWSGELILDADFVPNSNNNLHLTKSNWSSYVDFFDGINIYCKNRIENSYLQLTSIFPAYYEEK